MKLESFVKMSPFDIEAFNFMANSKLPTQSIPFYYRDEDFEVVRADIQGYDTLNRADGPDTVYERPPSLWITVRDCGVYGGDTFMEVILPPEFLDVLNEDNIENFNKRKMILNCEWNGKIMLKDIM